MADETDTEIGTLKVWYIPQVPMVPFEVVVYGGFAAAVEVLDAICQFSVFEYQHNVKPDYSDAGGICFFNGDDWCDVESIEEYEEMMAAVR